MKFYPMVNTENEYDTEYYIASNAGYREPKFYDYLIVPIYTMEHGLHFLKFETNNPTVNILWRWSGGRPISWYQKELKESFKNGSPVNTLYVVSFDDMHPHSLEGKFYGNYEREKITCDAHTHIDSYSIHKEVVNGSEEEFDVAAYAQSRISAATRFDLQQLIYDCCENPETKITKKIDDFISYAEAIAFATSDPTLIVVIAPGIYTTNAPNCFRCLIKGKVKKICYVEFMGYYKYNGQFCGDWKTYILTAKTCKFLYCNNSTWNWN